MKHLLTPITINVLENRQGEGPDDYELVASDGNVVGAAFSLEAASAFAAAPGMVALLQAALDAWPQLGTDEEMNGGDMVEWFGGFAEQAKALLAKAKGGAL